MRMVGREISAQAIMTRWHMPPDSSNGRWSTRRSGSEIPTSSSIFRTAGRARESGWRNASAICVPMVASGSRAACGSWKIIDMRRPRIACMARSEMAVMSSSPSRMVPLVRRIAGGSRRMMAWAVIDFPQPLSPTIAMTSPCATEKPMPSTTTASPMASDRLSTLRAGAVIGCGTSDRRDRAASPRAG